MPLAVIPTAITTAVVDELQQASLPGRSPDAAAGAGAVMLLLRTGRRKG